MKNAKNVIIIILIIVLVLAIGLVVGSMYMKNSTNKPDNSQLENNVQITNEDINLNNEANQNEISAENSENTNTNKTNNEVNSVQDGNKVSNNTANNIINNVTNKNNNTTKDNVTSKNNNSANSNNTTNNNTTNNKDVEVSNLSNNDLFAKYYEKAETLMSKMTLEEKVGQMFLVRFPTSGVIDQIKKYTPGGYILFGRDFKNETKSSMLKKLQNCQSASKINLALGVDEEGGTVVRVSAYTNFRSSKFLSPQQIWKTGKLPAILKDSTEKSNLLKSIGLNMNLAPVVDVPTKSSSFIYARSYGRGVNETCEYTSQLIKTMNNDGMISVMKHFPGYGDNVDTHTGIAIDKRAYSTFEKADFLPFKSGIGVGGPCILVNHNIVTSMDKNKPASLSKNVHDILRNKLNFSGIIMTDDLAMDAVKEYAENGKAATQAVLAGNDMIITSDFVKQRQEVITAVKQGKISEKLINNAVKRILAWKYAYKIIK